MKKNVQGSRKVFFVGGGGEVNFKLLTRRRLKH